MNRYSPYGYKVISDRRDEPRHKREFREAAQRVIRWIDDNTFVCAVWLCLFSAALTILALRVVGR